MGEDREHFLRWQLGHEERMELLQAATGHIWFQAYCMLNRLTREWFLDPTSWSSREKLEHWQRWVEEQKDLESCMPVLAIPLFTIG